MFFLFFLNVWEYETKHLFLRINKSLSSLLVSLPLLFLLPTVPPPGGPGGVFSQSAGKGPVGKPKCWEVWGEESCDVGKTNLQGGATS